MKAYFILLLLIGLGMAFTVKPDYFGIKDSGDQKLPTMIVDLSIDCDSKALTVNVSDASGPVEDATAYLFYTDYGYQPLPNSGKTGPDGIYTMPVTGNIEFLTALFIARVDHSTHQSREIEFAYEECFEEPECTSDDDCSDTEQCTDNECESVPCACGEVEDHQCTPYECCTDSDCASGEMCESNECVDEAVPEPTLPVNETDNDTVTAEPPDVTGPPVGDVAPPGDDICPLGFLLLAGLAARSFI
jgi:hypothetical protein